MHDDAPFLPYIDNDTMVAPFPPWQEEVVAIAQRLVCDYGFDGIFRDSWAWQMDLRVAAAKERITYTPAQWNEGVLSLTEKGSRCNSRDQGGRCRSWRKNRGTDRFHLGWRPCS